MRRLRYQVPTGLGRPYASQEEPHVLLFMLFVLSTPRKCSDCNSAVNSMKLLRLVIPEPVNAWNVETEIACFQNLGTRPLG